MSDYTPLCGRKIFKGIAEDNDYMFVKLDDKVYGLFKDNSDGYRSYGVMQGESDPKDYANLTFNLEYTPIEVDVEEVRTDDSDGYFEGIRIYGSKDLNSRTSEPICELGTDYSEDYYPCCIDSFDAEEATKVYRLQFEYIAEHLLLDKES
jgi:hypothetical protein